MLSLLTEMRHRPIGIWVGEKSLTKLVHFLHGFSFALSRIGLDDSLLADFGEWIRRRYPTKLSIGWWTLICQNSTDEDQAVDRFFELLDEFVAGRQEYVPEPLICRAASDGPQAEK
jgi:hypothetical protein